MSVLPCCPVSSTWWIRTLKLRAQASPPVVFLRIYHVFPSQGLNHCPCSCSEYSSAVRIAHEEILSVPPFPLVPPLDMNNRGTHLETCTLGGFHSLLMLRYEATETRSSRFRVLPTSGPPEAEFPRCWSGTTAWFSGSCRDCSVFVGLRGSTDRNVWVKESVHV